jgi:hypothetical protein
MKQIFRKFAFVAIVVFIIVGLVSSDGITKHKHGAIAQEVDRCFMVNSSGRRVDLSRVCPDNNRETTPSPYVNLTDQQRFLIAVANKLQTIPPPGSFEYILLREYGAVFVNQDPKIKLPVRVIFSNEQETKEFQSSLIMGRVNGTNCYLQKPAAEALNRVRSQVRISLKSGSGAADCTRTFATHQRFWRKYANNRTLERVRQGQETRILRIVAPPGTSQHLMGLAVDLRGTNQKQREALYKNGWFQTVETDSPHWTYMGVPKEKLMQLGFRNKVVGGVPYWVTPL